ncbi:MAG TPA: hypothetical protein VML00_03180 [Bacteroidota bacterium]|nr:hypothetical protein [Bacteroidota bacterium]
MKTERFEIFYLLFGLLCGFLLGSSIDTETGIWIRRALGAAGIFVVGFFWRRIEARAHRSHIEQWDEIAERGKWRFVIVNYVLIRGFVLLVILGGPAGFETRFSAVTLTVDAVAALLVIPLLVALGIWEWNECRRQIEISALRDAAEFITSKQN